MDAFRRIFGPGKPVIALVHLGEPLDGAEALVEGARADLLALQEAGVDAVMFGPDGAVARADAASVATMAYVVGRLRDEIRVPFGVNVLWDPTATVAVAAATGAAFAREIFTGPGAGDMGVWAPDAGQAPRYRSRLRRDDLAILHTVSAEVARGLDGRPLPARARAAAFPSAPDAVLVAGPVADLGRVKAALPDLPVLAHTDVSHDAVAAVLRVADGCVVGSALRAEGPGRRAVDPERARDFMARARGSCRELVALP